MAKRKIEEVPHHDDEEHVAKKVKFNELIIDNNSLHRLNTIRSILYWNKEIDTIIVRNISADEEILQFIMSIIHDYQIHTLHLENIRGKFTPAFTMPYVENLIIDGCDFTNFCRPLIESVRDNNDLITLHLLNIKVEASEATKLNLDRFQDLLIDILANNNTLRSLKIDLKFIRPRKEYASKMEKILEMLESNFDILEIELNSLIPVSSKPKWIEDEISIITSRNKFLDRFINKLELDQSFSIILSRDEFAQDSEREIIIRPKEFAEVIRLKSKIVEYLSQVFPNLEEIAIKKLDYLFKDNWFQAHQINKEGSKELQIGYATLPIEILSNIGGFLELSYMDKVNRERENKKLYMDFPRPDFSNLNNVTNMTYSRKPYKDMILESRQERELINRSPSHY